MEPVGYSLIASSPIDSCRGRGKYRGEPNRVIYILIQNPKGRKTLRNSLQKHIINK